MSDYRVVVEFPPDATDAEVRDLRAQAFEMALRHAVSDPTIRAKMLAGEAVKSKAVLSETALLNRAIPYQTEPCPILANRAEPNPAAEAYLSAIPDQLEEDGKNENGAG